MIIVERASEDDHPEIIEIDRLTIGNNSRSQYLTRAIINREMVVARLGAKRVGFAIVKPTFFEQYFVWLIVTHPDYRRQGVASALMNYIIRTCPKDKLFTSTNESNLPTQKLFESLGFIRSGYIENLDDDDPELVYVRTLK